MAAFDTSGLTPLDTSGLQPLAPPAAGLDISGLKPLDTSGLTPAPEEDPEWGGYASVAGRSLVRGVTDVAGEALKYGASIDPPFNVRSGVPRHAIPPAEYERLAAEDAARPKLVPQARPDYLLGQQVQEAGERVAPLTPTEEQSITSMAARGVPTLATALLPGGIAIAPTIMAASSGGRTFDEALQHGATEEDAAKAAGLSAIVGGGLGALPVGAILAPIRRTAPGLMWWAANKLEQVVQGGAAFASVGEAQEYLNKAIARAYYDPSSQYEFDLKRVLASAITGGLLGPLHPLAPGTDVGAAAGPGADHISAADAAEARARGAQTREEIDEFLRQRAAAEAAGAAATEGAVPADTIIPPAPEDAARPAAAPEEVQPTTPPQGQERPPQPPVSLEQLLNDPRSADEIRAEMDRAKATAAAQAADADVNAAIARFNAAIDAYNANSPNLSGTDPQRRALAQEIADARAEMNRLTAARGGSEGTRENPVKVETPADIDAVAHQVDPNPTPDQREAENYKMIHGTLGPGLDVSIETVKGGTRTAADGSWTVPNFPAYYGRFKGTVGADGDHVDFFYDGPKPFVIDQVDPQTHKFDEHKVVFANDEAHARAIYNAAFTDGSAEARLGAITPMSVDQLRSWLKNGNTKKPLAYEAPKPISAAPLQPKGPLSLMQFLASRGGLAPHSDLKAIGLTGQKRVIVPGIGWRNVVRGGGMSLDAAREAAIEAGYFHEPGEIHGGVNEIGINHILDALADEEGSRQRRFKAREELTDHEREDTSFVSIAERRAQVDEEIAAVVKETGLNLTPEELAQARELLFDGKLEPLDAIIEMVERSAIAEAGESAEHPKPEVTRAAPAPADETGAKAAPAGEPAGAKPSPAADEAPARVEPREAQRAQAERRQGSLPGTERISDAEFAQRGADRGLKPKVAQRPADEGLFGDEGQQSDLVDRARQAAPSLPDNPTAARLVDLTKRMASAPAGDKAKVAEWLKGQYATFAREGERIAAQCVEQGGRFSIR